MKRGLVIGKFMPIHAGHIDLINFAASQCNELIVSMSYTTSDPIEPDLRFSWIVQIFKGRPSISIAMVIDDFDNEKLPWDQRTKLWADFIFKTYPPIDVIFSSEEYGEPFAINLKAIHISYDVMRRKFPVSGTQIRKDPFNYWNYIPEIVKPYFVKKVCFYGPESTGKSFMAKKLADKYKTEFVPEVARELITSNDFTREDIIMIGRAQTERIFQKARKANKILFCDTDLITTQIYSRHYLKVVPPVLYELEKMVEYDLYFLFDIDVPWVHDGLRDIGEEKRRGEMYEIFRSELERRNISYIKVEGDWEEREKTIVKEIAKLMK
jgi:HTH-type transcriptional repressor of NAD biosynthesis genes